MGAEFSTPATMSDVLSKSDFPSGASYKLSDLGKITPGVSEEDSGGYRLSDFAGEKRSFGDSQAYGYNLTNGYKGFDMTGVEQITQGTDIASDDLTIPLMSLRAVVTFDENDEGIIFETGDNVAGCALYIDSKKLYWQAGAGDSIELLTNITGYSNGPREIVVTTDFRNNTIAGTLTVDGTLKNSVNTTGAATNVAGTDTGGSGKKYSNIAVLRNNQSSDFSGTIHSVRIYNF